MIKVRVNLSRDSYNIHIGTGLLAQTGTLLKEAGFTDKLAIITNPSLKKLYADNLAKKLTNDGFKVIILEVPEGEEYKSLETAGRLYQQLTDFYAERLTPILALGGGVIGDLAGFVAATYLRGVPLIQIPTTLLSQVDSSIGGKVAVNHDQLKNKIGAFYQPRMVISDIATLQSLTKEDFADGLAEAIKHGLIRDKEYFAYIESNLDRIKSLDVKALEEVVTGSARIKGAVVAEDERDFGLRNILNYGHTIGHAIESVSEFDMVHGQAVAIGMLVAAGISNRMGFLDSSETARTKAVIEKAGLPTQVPELETEELLGSMKHDKKITSGRIKFVLLKSIGEVFVTDEVNLSLVEQVLKERN